MKWQHKALVISATLVISPHGCWHREFIRLSGSVIGLIPDAMQSTSVLDHWLLAGF